MPDELKLNPRARFRAVDDEGVVVQIERDEVMVVNATGLHVLDLVRLTGSRAAVIEAITAEYETGDAAVAEDVDAFLADLRDYGILD